MKLLQAFGTALVVLLLMAIITSLWHFIGILLGIPELTYSLVGFAIAFTVFVWLIFKTLKEESK